MKVLAFALLGFVAVAFAGLLVWRQADHHADRAEMDRLRAFQPRTPAIFDPAVLAGLPEPAQRFFRFAIQPGARLFTVAEIEMTGRFSLGTKATLNYLPMTAHQVLASPHGFLWGMDAGSGLMRVSGSDSGQWTRFWLAGLAPVARVKANPDSRRSAFGRHVAESAFWTPAALLPGPTVRWEALGADTARAVVRFDGLEQAIEVSVAPDGRATQVVFARWSDANPDKRFQIQPFGGLLSEYKEFGGFRLPTHVEAGNFFGTDAYFPFFIADVRSVRFPPPTEGSTKR
jgi:hypothetical protein